MTIEIRCGLASERSELVELQRRASLANEGDRAALLAHPEAIDLPQDQLDSENVIVVVDHGRLAGFSAIYIREDGNAELDGLFVEPGLWKSGFGRVLVEQAAKRSRALGAHILHVVGNPHAEHFYTRVGFVQKGEFSTKFGRGLLMELAL
ncbi:GNAT family N-acetyltransferase [Roseibium sp. M-1]